MKKTTKKVLAYSMILIMCMGSLLQTAIISEAKAFYGKAVTARKQNK